MAAVEKRTIDLAPEHAGYIDAQVARGAYASASEVIEAGLRALQDDDDAVERWLLDEVAPVYDAMQNDPTRGIPSDDVFQRVRRHHARRTKTARGA